MFVALDWHCLHTSFAPRIDEVHSLEMEFLHQLINRDQRRTRAGCPAVGPDEPICAVIDWVEMHTQVVRLVLGR